MERMQSGAFALFGLVLFASLAARATALPPTGAQNAIKNPDLSMTDGMGGTVGWCCWNMTDSMVYGRPGKDGAIEVRFQGSSRTYFTQKPLELKNNGLYRLSAEVRTSGLKGAKVQLLLWDCGWHSDWGTPDFPDDTHGAWQKVSWEGRVPTKDDPKRYTVAVAGDGGGATDENVVGIRNFALEPLDDETAAATRGIPDSGLAQLVTRIVPVDPLLAKVRAAQAKFTLYWPGEPACGVAACRMDGLVDGAVRRQATLDGSGRAVLDFGRLKLGEHTLALRVTAPDGGVLAMNDYRFTARAEPPCGPSGRRLNNFVTELVRTTLRSGEVRFFRPEEGWVWIAFDGTDGKAVGFVDGEASPSVRRRPAERLTEAVRWVKAGWHVLRVKDAACGGLRIHAVKNLAQSACLLDFGPCDFSGECYKMTYPFWRRFVLPSLTVVNNAYRVIRRRPADLDAYRARGMGIWGEISIKFSSPLWLDAEGQWKALMDSDWGRGYDASVDESAIGAQRLQHVIFSENCWKMLALRPHQRVNMYWGDATQNVYNDPKVHASELMAIANTGDGHGVALPEMYAPVMRTPEETDRWIDLFERQTGGIGAFAPAAKAMTVFNVSPWIDLGHWSDYPHPEGDIKAMYARLLHAFATRPGFAENSGLAAGGSVAGDEETRRWLARLFRYYGLEGGTENLADVFGYRWAPGFVKNVDFDRGLADWTAEPAEKRSLRSAKVRRYGVRIQGRKKVPNGVGDNVASFVTSAARPNRLSQRVTGLEPGKLYALHFCAPNRADLKTPAKEVPPLAFRARLEGAEELAGLRFRHMAVNTKDKAAAKEGRCVHLPIYRYVFRAKASEATLVFEDRGEDGSAAPAGTEQILNYVIFRPYYVEAPGEADEIAAFMAPLREASADKRR